VTLRDRALALLGSWSAPPDLPAKLALGLAALSGLMAAFGGTSVLEGLDRRAPEPARERDRRRFVMLVAFVAALASVAYISIYLRGGPRIVDAATYFLQGRALAHGELAWTPPPGPDASYSGRFLLRRELAGAGTSLGGIFPPGYPLLLAVGFTLGAPMIVGPLLAAALVLATYRLARLVADEAFPDRAEPVARSAALFCAALRYHTADTMSHAASALGIVVALTAALRARREAASAPRAAIVCGLAVGYVVATRPVSAMPIAAVVAWLFATSARGARARVALGGLAGAIPGVALLLLSQRAVTGSWLASTQRMYYAISDGPPGCFRWGFGKGAGCLFEHRDFVEAQLRDGGYGPLAAAGTTLRRLHAHVLDVANLEPLALLVPLALVLRRRHAAPRAVTAMAALVGLQILAYAPFYFDGDYPGGGARFFADVLPIEHVLVVVAVASLVPAPALPRAALGLLTLSLAGFAVHGAFEHGRLRDRDGGRPMFEPDVLARAAVTRGLVFVDTDHGFALGHDPAERPDTGVLVARRRGDGHDRLLWEALGRPTTWRYELPPSAQSSNETSAKLSLYSPPDRGSVFRFEAEAEWPALAQRDGYAAPAWVGECASDKRALVLTPEPGRTARAEITLPVPSAGEWAIEPRVVHVGEGPGARGAIAIGIERWEVPSHPSEECTALRARTLALAPPAVTVVLEATGGPFAVDEVEIRKIR
jgi:hypothetical protein